MQHDPLGRARLGRDLFERGANRTFALQALGYDATSSLLGTEVIYQSLANGDLDVFLG